MADSWRCSCRRNDGQRVDAYAAGRSRIPCSGRLFCLLRLTRSAFWLQKAKSTCRKSVGGMIFSGPADSHAATRAPAPGRPPQATRICQSIRLPTFFVSSASTWGHLALREHRKRQLLRRRRSLQRLARRPSHGRQRRLRSGGLRQLYHRQSAGD